MRMRWCLGVLGAVALFASGANADTITLNVPVNVSNLMPQLDSVAVLCKTFDISKNQIAYNYSPFGKLDANGNYSGTLTVVISGNPGTASQAVTYRCSLVLAYPSGVLYANDLTVGTIPDDIGKSKPGTAFVPVVTGPISNGLPVMQRRSMPLGNYPILHH